MKVFFEKMMQAVHVQTQHIDIEGCEISIQESLKMIEILRKCLLELRTFFLEQEITEIEEEITFFKEMKPQILSYSIYFNKIQFDTSPYPDRSISPV